jgi:hypothetical protein
MIRRFAHLPLAASLCLLPLVPMFPRVAAAADPTMSQDEVTLKDGGTVRGTVVSSQPGVGVKIIELGQNESRMIPWAQVGDVERGKYAPRGAAAQPGSAGPGYAQPVPAATPAPGAPRYPVRLHVSSPLPANVYSHQTAYGAVNGYGFVIDAATPVCMSPCDQVFDAASGQMYTVGGDFNSSPAFSLGGRQGDVDLAVHPGSHGVRALGLALTIVGAVGVVVGAGFAVTGAIVPSTNTTVNADGSTSQTDAGTGWILPTGLGIMGGGAAMLVGGIIAMIESKTTIDLHSGSGATRTGSTGTTAPRYWLGEF